MRNNNHAWQERRLGGSKKSYSTPNGREEAQIRNFSKTLRNKKPKKKKKKTKKKVTSTEERETLPGRSLSPRLAEKQKEPEGSNRKKKKEHRSGRTHCATKKGSAQG